MPSASSKSSSSATRNSGTTRSAANPKSLAPTTSLRPQPRPNTLQTGSNNSNYREYETSSSTTSKPLSFDIAVTGLKPNTKHDFYYQNKLMTTECRSMMPDANIGTTNLVSDASGKLNFKFQMSVRAVVTSKNGNVISTMLDESTGSKVFELRGQKSSAKSLVEFKDF